MKGSWIVTVEKNGRITLPKELMNRMGWKVGDALSIRVVDGGILLTKILLTKKGVAK